ncbi:MAG: trypsin-like peptidase domain-containing protein [Tabrizicola sp.]|uniref:trypsin-like peptidase domain-containing protein n=1 Tax=Tabrizicola sp. TaxID=2005166 RepID=UPI002AB87F20|nr:trypsin-like peptidase domain-containing protein [Tabrizicola sp.]MDZ4085534.1 trypsin-like peptidase domain-containing protein [Tabrizicola sp.]
MQAKSEKRQRPLHYIEALAALLVLALVALIQPVSASPLDDAMDKVFTVRSNDAEDRFLGSAFLWHDGTVAVTNAHVVGEADEVRLIDRHGTEIPALVIARDPVRDVAVLSVPEGTQGLPLASNAPQLGDEVFALGAPLGIEFTLTEGRISALARQTEVAVPILMLQHDAAVNPGSSGGPLVDAAGRILGMNSRIADGSRMFVGIAYAIPTTELTRIVTGLIDETLPPFPTLGLTARPVDRQIAETLGTDAQGLLVDTVAPGSLAEAAGLRAGDILVATDEVPLVAPGDFAFAIERASEAGQARLSILRAWEPLTLTLQFTASEPTGLRTREITRAPTTVAAYSLAELGVTLDPEGVVTALTDNSPALIAGLAKGDRILSINGTQPDLSTFELTAPALFLLEAPGGATRHIRLDPWHAPEGVRPVGGANVLDPDVVVF